MYIRIVWVSYRPFLTSKYSFSSGVGYVTRPILLIMWTAFQSFTLRDNNKHKATLWDTKYLSVKFRPNVECDQVVAGNFLLSGRTCFAVVIAFAAVSLADYCLPIIWHNCHFNKNVYLMMPSTSETEIVWIQKYLISKYTWQTSVHTTSI